MPILLRDCQLLQATAPLYFNFTGARFVSLSGGLICPKSSATLTLLASSIRQ
jgi:hypothetical protein